MSAQAWSKSTALSVKYHFNIDVLPVSHIEEYFKYKLPITLLFARGYVFLGVDSSL